jgi:hypothetical protein
MFQIRRARIGWFMRVNAAVALVAGAVGGVAVLPVSAASGRRATPRELTVLPRPVMEVRTIAKQGDADGVEIRNPTSEVVHFYRVDHTPKQYLQVVVLNRSTLDLVSNKTYDADQIDSLKQRLKELDATKLVIVSDQLWGSNHGRGADAVGPADLSAVLGEIGVGRAPRWVVRRGHLPEGVFSAIGVPRSGDTPGFSTYRYSPGPLNFGDINGYLIRDVNGQYAFQSWEHLDFNTRAEHPNGGQGSYVIKVGSQRFPYNSPNPDLDRGGFEVVLVNRYTGHGTAASFATNYSGRFSVGVVVKNLDSMAALLEQANSEDAMDHGGDLVIVASVGDPECPLSACKYPDKSPQLDKAVTRVAFDIAKLGGTVGPIFGIMDSRSKQNRGSYTLVGQSRAGYGRGLESSKFGRSAYEEGNLAPLEGTLTRSSRDFGLSVEGEDVPGTGEVPLVEVVNQRAGPWPNQDNSMDNAALAWIGDDVGLGPDPRAQYYSNRSLNWTDKRKEIEKLDFPADHPGFEKANFTWAQGELGQEISWLLTDRRYLAQVAKPYTDSGFQSWAALTDTAAKINNEVNTPKEDKTAASWQAVVLGLAEVGKLIPGVGHGIEVARAVYTTALELYRINRPEQEPGTFEVKVGELGRELAKRLDEGQQTITNTMFNETVADYHKLETVAECVQAKKQCKLDPGKWQITPDDYRGATNAFQLSLEQMFYGALLSAKYTAWVTPSSEHSDPRGWNGQGGFYPTPVPRYPFKNVADGGYLVRVNRYNVYEEWVLGKFDGDRLFPSLELPKGSVVDRLWKPIDKANPTAENGGLGLDREQFFARWFEPPQVICGEIVKDKIVPNGALLHRCEWRSP